MKTTGIEEVALVSFKHLAIGDRFRHEWGGYVYIKTSARRYKPADHVGTVKRSRMSVKVEVVK